MRRQPFIAAAAVLVLGAVALVSQPASDSASAAPAAPTADAIEAQAAHFAVLDEIARFDQRQEVSQLGMIEGDPAAGTISIGWVGDVPAAVRDIADAAADQGIAITFTQQSRSAEALRETAVAVATSLPQEASIVVDVAPDELTVNIPTEAAADAVDQPTIVRDDAADAAIDAVVADAESTGVQVEVEQTEAVPEPAMLVMGRLGDANDLRGGSRYLTQWPNGSWINCTSGFQAVYAHMQQIVTAAHCSDYADGRPVATTNRVGIGVSDGVAELNDGPRAYDLGLVRLDQPIFNLASIYADPIATTLPVVGYLQAGMPAGYTFCSSGQITSAKCNLTSGAPAIACYNTASHGQECQWIVKVTASPGTMTFCFGDSGGPVFSRNGAGEVIAAAVVSGIVRTPTSGNCGPTGYVAPIADLMTTIHGIQLRVEQR